MRRIVTTAVLTATIAVGFFTHAPHAWACSCLATTLEQRYEAADFVFNGRVRSVVQDARGVEVEVALDEIFKGALPRALMVRTAESEASCGYVFVRDSRYTIFAHQQGDELFTSACSGTTDDPAVRTDVRALSTTQETAPSLEPGAPLASDDAPVATGSSRAGPIAAAALLVAAMIFFVGWVRLTR